MVEEFKSLGEYFKEERLKKGIDLKEISQKTKISLRYLEAIENDDFDKVSISDFYKKGVVRKYANYLGLDESEILERYRSQYGEEKEVFVETSKKQNECKWQYIVYLFIAVIVFLTFYLTTNYDSQKPEYVPSESQNNNIAFSEVDTYTPAVEIYTPTVESTEEIYTSTIKVVAIDRTWMRVTYEDEVIYEGILNAGDIKIWTYSPLLFHVGNAGGIEVFYNDESLGVLGRKGEVLKKQIP
ncbi:MAG TPA: DUF4115 domain-containing protein [Dictyoglomaceae bacterium]|nr:DUF4115 domain-containing protein [Dictyoglomaceae bacterium]HOL39107.1 DUF4115 domain-containing protein [Dictyoglomaceae bacterium]HOP94284.1 DUF4115 domain-containing protein [Dictyoglomaceae bacterium]HPP15261.1 DUF4115 domain-containing protein [Dictyoglomaceae bacterium]HPU42667.1 DUF4115 domain-containing protein [Dictyoglomaceae bacterium]